VSVTTGKGQLTDVVVIGCGAGGGVIAKELGEAGLSVVVLEAGKRFTPSTDYTTDRHDFELHAPNVFDPDDARRDLYTSAGAGQGFYYNRAKGVGGSTLHYLAVSPRLHESDFRVHTEDGVGADWPISYADLEPYYTLVEQELGVSGPHPDDANPFDPPRRRPFPTAAHEFNRAGWTIKRAADKLGLHMVREPLAIPTKDWNGRPACIEAGTCGFGCRIRAKSSIDVTYVPKAEATGLVQIRPQCMAREITRDPDSGKARSVIYLDSRGHEQEIAARAIVVAGNAVETSRLLLLSKSRVFPGGLANSSGLVGTHFMEHLDVNAYGVFAERQDPWRGVPTGGMIQDYYATDSKNRFARGWTFLVSSGSQWPLAVGRRVGGWGSDHKARVKELFGRVVGIASVGEQLPDAQNRVTLDPIVKDCFDLPVPRILNEPRANDREMIAAITSRSTDLLQAAGATDVSHSFQPGTSAHYLGGCRMGSDPTTSVVDAWCRTHDVPNLFIGDGSVFVTAGAVNPALTISALATRTAEGIVNAFERREL
jgi:choline dehydrogenase-like flavoprotein